MTECEVGALVEQCEEQTVETISPSSQSDDRSTVIEKADRAVQLSTLQTLNHNEDHTTLGKP